MSLKTAIPIPPPSLATAEASPSSAERLAGFVALTKPRIAVMVLLTVAVGYVLGTGARPCRRPSC